jgi:hypothetical protein
MSIIILMSNEQHEQDMNKNCTTEFDRVLFCFVVVVQGETVKKNVNHPELADPSTLTQPCLLRDFTFGVLASLGGQT